MFLRHWRARRRCLSGLYTSAGQGRHQRLAGAEQAGRGALQHQLLRQALRFCGFDAVKSCRLAVRKPVPVICKCLKRTRYRSLSLSPWERAGVRASGLRRQQVFLQSPALPGRPQPLLSRCKRCKSLNPNRNPSKTPYLNVLSFLRPVDDTFCY